MSIFSKQALDSKWDGIFEETDVFQCHWHLRYNFVLLQRQEQNSSNFRHFRASSMKLVHKKDIVYIA